MPMAPAMGPALCGPTSTAAPALTPQVLLFAKNLRPHLIVVSVWAVTCSIAAVIESHFGTQPEAPPQGVSSGPLAIEPDLSRMTSRSGGTFCRPYCWSPQLGPSRLGPTPVAPVPVPVVPGWPPYAFPNEAAVPGVAPPAPEA